MHMHADLVPSSSEAKCIAAPILRTHEFGFSFILIQSCGWPPDDPSKGLLAFSLTSHAIRENYSLQTSNDLQFSSYHDCQQAFNVSQARGNEFFVKQKGNWQ